MRRLLLILLTFAAAGCSQTADPDPFALDRDSGLAVDEGVASLVGTAVGAVGYALDAIGLSNDRPPSYYAERLVAQGTPADVRAEAINGLVRNDFAKREPYTDAYAVFAADAPDPLVRATAIRALNRSGDRGRTGLLVAALDDADARVRIEAR